MQSEKTALICGRTRVSLIKNDEKAVIFQIRLGEDRLGPDRSRALGVDIAVEFGTSFEDEEYSREDLCEDFRSNSEDIANSIGLVITPSKRHPAKIDISPDSYIETSDGWSLGHFILTISPAEWHDIVATMARLME
jgi:hypothetical protein